MIVLSLMSVISYGAVCKPIHAKSYVAYKIGKDSLAMYTGRFQSVQKQGTFLVEVLLTEDGRLLAHSLWDGNKYGLNHINGDNFMMQGFDWSVKFIKGKDGKVTSMLVKGTEYWDKVKDL